MSTVEKKQKVLTRRDFVKGAAAGAAGGFVMGAAGTTLSATKEGSKPWLPAKWDYQTDMLVIGAGSAGQMATIEAHDKGAKVIMTEMAPSPYFSESSVCGGSASVPKNPMQIKQGILDDSPDLMFEDMSKVGMYSNREDILRLFVDNELEAFTRFWELGAKPLFNKFVGGHSRIRTVSHIARQTQEALLNQIKKRGITTLFNCRVNRLIVDPKTKRVLGVEAKNGVVPPDYTGGKTIFIKSKVTVLATGGMCGNPEMLRRYVPRTKALACWAEEGLPGLLTIPEGPARPIGLGDGYRMAMAIGADTTHMYTITMYLGTPVGPNQPKFGRALTPRWRGDANDTSFNVFLVNKAGKRFYNEYEAPCDVGEASQLQEGKTCFPICDNPVFEASLALPKWSNIHAHVAKLLKEGGLPYWSANTIEELAAKAGINPTGLKEQVEKWNQDVAKGVDSQFGRLMTKPHTAYQIKTPPFHTVQYSICPLHNAGGLRANNRLQIMDVEGNPIPGLYGAGEVIGGTSGEVYLSSSHWPVAITMGYLVGKKLAIGEALA